jgi:hypothetical protein
MGRNLNIKHKATEDHPERRAFSNRVNVVTARKKSN